MSHEPLAALPVHQLSRLIQQREISPVELVDSCLDSIARREPRLQAFVAVHAPEARLAAQGAEAAIRAGHSVGPLHGIPIALKDLIEIEGQVFTGGSEAFKDRKATRTATLARKLVAQGVILLGKTHTVEFAMGGWGTNTLRGTPWNPWDLQVKRTPGGSSNGSAVAVAGRLVPWAVGTDTGGSIRMPASWCGITGLKTSTGRISTYGIQPLSTTLDTPGPMARCVEDVALLYAAMQGADPHDPLTAGLAYADPLPALQAGIRGLRLARMPESERRYASAEVLAAYDESLRALQALGAEIVTLELPFRFEDVAAFNMRIMAAESYALHHALIDDPAAPLDPDVRPRIAAGRDISARAYLEAVQQRGVMKQQFAQAMQGIDALLTPSTMTTALPLSEVDQTKAPAHYTRFGNYLDLCGLSLPNGFDSQGLPTSLQILCRSQQEDLALRIGWAYEQATVWNAQLPPGLE